MKREIWEFLVAGRDPVIREWSKDEKLSASERAKLDVCLDRLRTLDFGLVGTKLLAGPLRGNLYKLRLRCENRELRPRLCRGPIAPSHDYTLLLGAIEKDGKSDPRDADERAGANRESLISNVTWRKRY